MIKNSRYRRITGFALLIAISVIMGCGDDDPVAEMEAEDKRASDSLVLVSLYNSTNGADWDETWDLNSPMDEWFGITLHPTGAVKYIQLQGNGLVGSLPDALGELSELEYLYIRWGQLSGGIPESLSTLSRLKELRLDGNGLSGTIPAELTSIPFLSIMQLSDNNLTGPIPSGLGSMQNIDFIALDNNLLTGTLPEDIGQLQGLFSVNLNNNNLSGCIPSTYMNLCSGLTLNMSFNPLLPWEGNADMFCGGFPQTGAPCMTNGEAGMIDSNCDCK